MDHIEFTPKKSYLFISFFSALLLFAMVAVLLSEIVWEWKIPLIIIIIIIYGYFFAKQSCAKVFSRKTFVYKEDQWYLKAGDRELKPVDLFNSSYLSCGVLLLRFQCQESGKHYHHVFAQDSLDEETFRKLRVILESV